MPKVVDNYVFERKIGSGQYGFVFKGYNKLNGQDIAIKAIKRQNIKGKFMELLQNQIKVLKTCDNKNIIRLYDIKKTANNFYLILQYCNEGDLSVYLKKKKILSQEQAIQFLIQIVNAFKTLVQHKIMHRDFKLANILIHDSQIKIADFGFSKLLTNQQFTDTMLGSPLNMAPEVLGGNNYNNKADIWSIGVVFYEMLFGSPPYKASNMVDLVNNIKNKPITFSRTTNHISQITEDFLRKVLTVDPKKRIQWQVLFQHPILSYLEDKIKLQMQDTMKETQDITLNMSKFYLKANQVVDHPKEIEKKQNINNYAINVITKKQTANYHGDMIKRQTTRKKSYDKCFKNEEQTQASSKNQDKDIITEEQTIREKQIKAFKKNAKFLLHHRNIYVFLASVAQEAIGMTKEIPQGDIVAYLLIRKLLKLLQWLKQKMDNKHQFKGMQYWQLYIKERDFEQIRQYVQKQYNVFRIFQQSVRNRICEKIKYLDEITKETIANFNSKNNQKVYQSYLQQYIQKLSFWIHQNQNSKPEKQQRKYYIHLERIIDCLNTENVFIFQQNGHYFNFHNHYEQPQRIQLKEYKKIVQKKFETIY